MKRERFSRVKELILAVSDLPEGERETYLDEACADDPQLRQEVEPMLAREADPSGMLKTAGAIRDQVPGREEATSHPTSPAGPSGSPAIGP